MVDITTAIAAIIVLATITMGAAAIITHGAIVGGTRDLKSGPIWARFHSHIHGPFS